MPSSRSYLIDKPALVSTNRLVPFAWEPLGAQTGFICAYTESFLHSAMRGVSLKDSMLYLLDGNPVYYFSDE